jgi:hypothetical protein
VVGAVPHDDQLPVETVRDLLALARAMWAVTPKHASAARLKLEGIGYQLRLALEKASLGAPGTLHHRCAWLIAERAAQDLGAIVDESTLAKELIGATSERLRRKA